MRRDRTIYIVCLALAALGLLPAPALGQGAALPSEAIGLADGIRVEINKGEMLRLSRTATSIIVADPAIADVQVVSPRVVYIHGKKIGETSLLAIDAQDNPIVNVTVEVTHNLTKLNRAVKEMLPGADVQFTTVDGGLVMNGVVSSPMESDSVRNLANSFLGTSDKLVNMVSALGSDQVMLMVKVVEVSRNDLKKVGINLESVLSSGNFAFTVFNARDLFDDETGGILRSATDHSLLTSFRTGSHNINGIIDALADEGLVSVLAEPNLTTSSGKPASFLAGGEIPVPSLDRNGSIIIDYKPFGVSLNFTPVVLTKERISLTVAPEVSNLSDIGSVVIQGFNIPSLITRKAETTVELGSGQSFAIAGLLQNNRANDIQRFPGLGEVPVLGQLFRSNSFRNDQTELVIIVTPYVVRGVSGQMATPLDGYVPPTDLEILLRGKLYKEQPAPGSENGEQGEGEEGAEEEVIGEGDALPMEERPRLHGSGGHILE